MTVPPVHHLTARSAYRGTAPGTPSAVHRTVVATEGDSVTSRTQVQIVVTVDGTSRTFSGTAETDAGVPEIAKGLVAALSADAARWIDSDRPATPQPRVGMSEPRRRSPQHPARQYRGRPSVYVAEILAVAERFPRWRRLLPTVGQIRDVLGDRGNGTAGRVYQEMRRLAGVDAALATLTE